MSTYNIPKNSSITINDAGGSVTAIAFNGLIRDFSAPDSPLTAASVKDLVSNAGSTSSKTITLSGSVTDILDESVFDIAKVKGFSIQNAVTPFCIEAVSRVVVTVTGSNAKQNTERDSNNATSITTGTDVVVPTGKKVYLWNTSGTVTLTFKSGNAKLSGQLSTIPGLTISDTGNVITSIDRLIFPSAASNIPCLSGLAALATVDISFPGNVNLAGWFENCTSLTIAKIHVTGNLTGHSNLFKGCTSLVKASLYVDGSTTAGASTNVMTSLSTTGTFYVGGSVVGKFTLPSNWLAVNITDTASNPLPIGIVAREASTVKLHAKGYSEDYEGSDLNRTFSYSLDNITWSSYTPDTVINLAAGRAVFFKGDNSSGLTTGFNTGNWAFTLTGKVDVIGCVSSLLNNGTNTTVTPCENCFLHLFDGNSAIVDASGLDMDRCTSYPGDSDGSFAFGFFMFSCTYLKKLPKLPSKIMRKALNNAFARCDRLEYAYLSANSAKSMGLEQALMVNPALTIVVIDIASPSNALTFNQLLFTNTIAEGTIYFPKVVQNFTIPVESVPANWTIKYY